MHLIQKPRRMMITGLYSAGILMSGCHGAALGAQMLGGSGQVLNTTTNLPVPDAEVSLECQRYVNIEGLEKVRTVKVTTDDTGVYSFTDKDVSGCDIGFVRVNKLGYIDASKIHVRFEQSTDYNHLPKVRYLTPAADAVLLKLRLNNPQPRMTLFYGGRIPTAAEEHSAKPNEPADQEYFRVYSAFFEAKWIAETPEEKKFVIDHYCKRLEDLYAGMSNQEKAQATSHTVSYEEIDDRVDPVKHTAHLAPTDPKTEVTPYCASAGARKSLFTYQFAPNSSCLIVTGDPAIIKNTKCNYEVDAVIIFGQEGKDVETASLPPGQEKQLAGTGSPRFAECTAGQVPVTASGQLWTGKEHGIFCRASAK